MTDEEQPSDEAHEIVPASTRAERALDTGAALANFVPLLGGVISGVLSGLSQDQKLQRVNEVLWAMSEDIRELSEESRQYVKSEDFRELLEETLRRVHGERYEEKRTIYRRFLVGEIKSPGSPYDEQIRFLRTLEQLQPDHLRILRACVQEPEADAPRSMGSRKQTLSRRLPDMPEDRIADLVSQLNDLHVTDLGLGGLMTGAGAANLKGSVTPFGQRFIGYLEAEVH